MHEEFDEVNLGVEIDPEHAEREIMKRLAQARQEAEDQRTEVQKAIDTFNRYKLDDLIAYKIDTAHHLAGRGFLKRGAGTLLIGGTSLGKSVLANQIGISIAGGLPILGMMSVKAPSRVLYVQAENDAEVLQRDTLSIVKHIKADHDLINQNLRIYHAYGLAGKRFAEWLAVVAEYENPDLIIIDPYQSYIGAHNINDSTSALMWLSPIDELIKQRNCALMLVAHTPKPADREDWNVMQNVYMAAGTSVLANWARASCELLTVGKQTDRFKMTFGKNPATTGLTNACGGGILREIFLEHSDSMEHPYWKISADQTAPDKASQSREKVKNVMTNSPGLSKSEIARAAGTSRTTVDKYFDQLVLELEQEQEANERF